MKNVLRNGFFLLAVVFFAGSPSAFSQNSPANAADVKKIDGFFKASKRTVRSPSSGVWGFDENGRTYFFAIDDDILVGGVILFESSILAVNTTNYQALLKMNHRFDYVKITIDGEGDIALRFDAPVKVLDQKTFDRLVTQLIRASNDIISEFK